MSVHWYTIIYDSVASGFYILLISELGRYAWDAAHPKGQRPPSAALGQPEVWPGGYCLAMLRPREGPPHGHPWGGVA